MADRGSILWLVLLGVIIISAHSFSEITSFQGLGDLSGGGFHSWAFDVSADGSVVVGKGRPESGAEAFRWENNVMTGLGDFGGGGFWSYAYGVSADGSVVVGEGRSESGDKAFRWENNVMTGLGDLGGGGFWSYAYGVSADGLVVVGFAGSESGAEAFRWENNVMTGLGSLGGGGFSSSASDISADGSVVVGYSRSVWGYEAFRWENNVMTGLGDLEGGYFDSSASDVSADGSVVVGTGNSESGFEAFRWENNVMIGLGDLEGGDFWSNAYGVSADGSVVIGKGRSESGDEAFIWDSTNGMRSLQSLLEYDYGLDLTGWTLESAQGISADGLTIVGWGKNPDGYTEGWIARIPEPDNSPPVADAGAVQEVFVCADGVAEVKLDGSGSIDADGDELEYLWTWAIDANEMTATGVDPNIMLPVGEHTIELVVNDGTEDSEPDEVVITAITPVEADVHIVPRVINRRSRMKSVIAIVRLPDGIGRHDVADEPFEMYVDEVDGEPIEASWQRVIGWGNMTRVFALFDKDEVMNAVEHNGRVELTVVGRLESGQYIYGSDTVRIIQPQRRPRMRLRLR